MCDISLILPTRERVSQAKRALESVFQTADRPEQLEVILYVDWDDVPSHSIDHPHLKIVQLIRPRAKMGAMTQFCLQASTGRYIMLMNDDIVFRTGGWDTAIRSTFGAIPDDIGLVWGNDLFREGLFPTHPVLSRTVCDIVGCLAPSQFHRDYIDAHLYDIFCRLKQLGHGRLIYLPDLVFEHLHVEAGKALPDRISQKHRKNEDEWTYIAWDEERQLAAVRLAQHITLEASAKSNRRQPVQTEAGARQHLTVGTRKTE